VILARVRRTLRERGLVEPGMRVLAACSGGPDSGAMLMALARLSAELDFTLEAASVDHGLRADAAADVAIAREQATAAGVAFHALQVSVDRAGSLQANARSARYAALQAHARQIGAQRIAVGHTQDDQAETVVLRVLRGAGLSGLSGIAPLRADGVMRPLIDCRRADVLAFATQHCPRVAHDASNQVRQFGRVRVRQDLLPMLEREDRAAIQHLSDLADDARAASVALLREAETLLEASLQGDGSIDVSSWLTQPSAVRRGALRSWVARVAALDVGRSPLIGLERAVFARAEVWLSAGWVARSAGEGRITLARDPATSTA
jgi:tRNA(Ile)-lysidine synthase